MIQRITNKVRKTIEMVKAIMATKRILETLTEEELVGIREEAIHMMNSKEAVEDLGLSEKDKEYAKNLIDGYKARQASNPKLELLKRTIELGEDERVANATLSLNMKFDKQLRWDDIYAEIFKEMDKTDHKMLPRRVIVNSVDGEGKYRHDMLILTSIRDKKINYERIDKVLKDTYDDIYNAM